MIQRSRKPALSVLLLATVLAVGYLLSTGAEARRGDGPSLAELEVAIADPEAGAATWLLYAQRLQQAKRYTHAASAYQRVLEEDPYSQAANLQCATALALAGDADRFHDFMDSLILIEPRLALDIFGRPEAQRYLHEERFQALLKLARVQSMD